MPALVVLDASVLRNQPVVEACTLGFDADGTLIALPEMALFELAKHPARWEYTVRKSLAHLARRPEAVVLTRSSKPLGLAEEATGIPTQTMVDDGLTDALRGVLRDLDRGGGPDLADVLDSMKRHRGQLEHEAHASDSLQAMQTLKAIGQTSFPTDVVARVGRDLADRDRTSFRELLINTLRIAEVRNAHVRRGVEAGKADALLDAPAVTYLYALAVGALGLEWIFRGGIENASSERVANDILDIEYAIAALWAGRLISEDGRSRARFDDLKAIGASAWPEHAAWFRRATAEDPVGLLRS